MYGKPKPSAKKKTKASPIRVVIRCVWSNERLSVPTDAPLPPIKLSTKLQDLVARLESRLPPQLFQSDSKSAALVCLRQVVNQADWATTSLKEILGGDDGSSGVILSLELSNGAASSSSVGNAISSAASSLSIKPVIQKSSGGGSPAMSIAQQPDASSQSPEPMDIDTSNETLERRTPNEAWSKVLQSNFDSSTKDCLVTLLRMIDNVLSKPNEPKVRSIRCANVAFDKKVGQCKGGYEFLYSIGWLPRYAALGGSSGIPEVLELAAENESRETLLRGRQTLVQSALRDLQLSSDDLPKLPKAPETLTASTLAQPPASTRPSNSRGSTGFNVYKTHSHNIQSAAMGAPDPYSDASSTLSSTERQLQQLQTKKDRLESEMQASIEADRGLVAYLPGQGPVVAGPSTASSGSSAGKSDSSLVAARMKRMQEERKKQEEGGFTTKAMRDLEKLKKGRAYSHATIRVNFADGSHIHAKFLPKEKVSSIRSIIKSAFLPSVGDGLDFDLYVAPPRRLLDEDKTLNDEELVPAAKIHVSWKVGGAPTASSSPGSFLQPGLFSTGGSVGASFPDAKPLVKAQKTASTSASSEPPSEGQSKEDLLMQRMLGKKGGLLGTKKKSDSSEKGEKKSGGRPKWFKG